MNSGDLISNNDSNTTNDFFINNLIDKIFNNQQVSFDEAYTLLSTDDISTLFLLIFLAWNVTPRFR